MNDKLKLVIRIRKATEEDIPFIFNSWLKSYRNSMFAKPIANQIYFTEHHKVIENIVKHNEVLVACSNQDPSEVYGYCCAGRVDGIFSVHYVYVKHSFRRMGIGKTLLSNFNYDPTLASLFTHHTRIGDKLSQKYNMIYHPYVIYGPSYLNKGTIKPQQQVELEVSEEKIEEASETKE